MKLRNNKGKAAGSGTVSNARRERYRKACEERDKFLETSTDIAKAKELQRANQKKPVGDGAASSMEVKDEKKGRDCTLSKRARGCTLSKEQGSAPCQKEQAKVEGKREEAAPCQKEQTKKQQEVDVKVEEKKRDAPCQKE